MLRKLTSNIKYDVYKWTVTVLTGLFMFVVLYVYKGYNIDQIPSLSGHSLFLRAVMQAIATSLVFYVCEFHIRNHFKLSSSLRQFPWIVGEILIGIHVAFLLFNYFWQWTEMRWDSYFMFFYEYPLVVVFPILISQLLARISKNSESHLNNYIIITSENKKDHFKIRPAHLLFLRAAGNYVEVYHSSNGQIRKHLIRKSLKELDQEHSSNPHLVRCHRSYMVNPGNIDHIQSSGKSVKLALSGIEVPVSEKHISQFSARFNDLSVPYLESSSQIA